MTSTGAELSMAGGKGIRGEEVKITVSSQAHEDLAAIAEWKGMALGLYLRTIVEAHHENPGTQSLIRRAKSDLASKVRKNTPTQD